MVMISSEKRLIGKGVLKKVADDILLEQSKLMGRTARLDNLTEHLSRTKQEKSHHTSPDYSTET